MSSSVLNGGEEMAANVIKFFNLLLQKTPIASESLLRPPVHAPDSFGYLCSHITAELLGLAIQASLLWP